MRWLIRRKRLPVATPQLLPNQQEKKEQSSNKPNQGVESQNKPPIVVSYSKFISHQESIKSKESKKSKENNAKREEAEKRKRAWEEQVRKSPTPMIVSSTGTPVPSQPNSRSGSPTTKMDPKTQKKIKKEAALAVWEKFMSSSNGSQEEGPGLPKRHHLPDVKEPKLKKQEGVDRSSSGCSSSNSANASQPSAPKPGPRLVSRGSWSPVRKGSGSDPRTAQSEINGRKAPTVLFNRRQSQDIDGVGPVSNRDELEFVATEEVQKEILELLDYNAHFQRDFDRFKAVLSELYTECSKYRGQAGSLINKRNMISAIEKMNKASKSGEDLKAAAQKK